MRRRKSLKTFLITLLVTCSMLGIVATAATYYNFNFQILETGAASSAQQMKNAGVSKANVQVTYCNVPGMSTNFIIAKTGSGTQVTPAFQIATGGAATTSYSYNGVSYINANFNEALRGNATATGFGYIISGSWAPNFP